MSESVMESQDEAITRKPEGEKTGMGDDKQAALDDIGCNADVYISNQVAPMISLLKALCLTLHVLAVFISFLYHFVEDTIEHTFFGDILQFT